MWRLPRVKVAMDDVEVHEWLDDEEMALFAGPMMPVLRELALARQAMVVLTLVTDGQPTGAIQVSKPGAVVRAWAAGVEAIKPIGWNVYQRTQGELQKLREEIEEQRRKELLMPSVPGARRRTISRR